MNNQVQTKKLDASKTSNVMAPMPIRATNQELLITTTVEVYSESASRELKVTKPTKPTIKSGRPGQVHSSQT
ncbi:unnamed protein product [Amaranthus hypochondriacus]